MLILTFVSNPTMSTHCKLTIIHKWLINSRTELGLQYSYYTANLTLHWTFFSFFFSCLSWFNLNHLFQKLIWYPACGNSSILHLVWRKNFLIWMLWWVLSTSDWISFAYMDGTRSGQMSDNFHQLWRIGLDLAVGF